MRGIRVSANIFVRDISLRLEISLVIADRALHDLDSDRLSAIVVDAAFQIHRELGPGLLESVYEVVLAHSLEALRLMVERQKLVPFTYRGMRFDEGFRVDLMINQKLLVEVKSVEQLSSVDSKQLLT